MNEQSTQLTQGFRAQAGQVSATELETFDASLDLLLWGIDKYDYKFQTVAIDTAMKRLEAKAHELGLIYRSKLEKI